MKRLSLLRHAKSGWDDPVARDFDRPLNERGRRAARTIGAEMRRLGLGFDAVRASPARRVVETIAEVEAGFGNALAPEYEERLYLASPATLLDVIRSAPDSESLLIIGHNPGLEQLVLALTRRGGGLRSEVEVKYPTATLAEISLPIGRWAEAEEGGGALERFIRPRDLDRALGPDEPD